MGLFNFGTKALVKNQLIRIATGMEQVENEMKKSNQDMSLIRGIASALMKEKNKLTLMLSDLSPAARSTIKLKYKGQRVSYFEFATEMMNLSTRIDNITGINFFNETRTIDGVARKVQF